MEEKKKLSKKTTFVVFNPSKHSKTSHTKNVTNSELLDRMPNSIKNYSNQGK